MKTSGLVLVLVAAVSAIDIRMWVSSNSCQGGGAAAVCTGWNPDTCCGNPSGGFDSIGFYGIPLDWFIEVRGHESGNCANTKTVEATSGVNFRCLTNGPYTGSGYGFRSKKRDAGACAEEGAPKECAGYQRPDIFETGTRQRYSLVDLTDDEMLELIEQNANGTIADAYQKHENLD